MTIIIIIQTTVVQALVRFNHSILVLVSLLFVENLINPFVAMGYLNRVNNVMMGTLTIMTVVHQIAEYKITIIALTLLIQAQLLHANSLLVQKDLNWSVQSVLTAITYLLF